MYVGHFEFLQWHIESFLGIPDTLEAISDPPPQVILDPNLAISDPSKAILDLP